MDGWVDGWFGGLMYDGTTPPCWLWWSSRCSFASRIHTYFICSSCNIPGTWYGGPISDGYRNRTVPKISYNGFGIVIPKLQKKKEDGIYGYFSVFYRYRKYRYRITFFRYLSSALYESLRTAYDNTYGLTASHNGQQLKT